MINTEAGRCLLCKIPRCASACAVQTDVPTAVRLYKEGKTEEAAALLYAKNPFSAITSLVCDWKRQCCGHCVLNARKSPVRWHEIEAEISCSHLMGMHVVPPEQENGLEVAVVGCGPAGITAALDLREQGFKVTVYDRYNRPGGILRYGIPGFRLDPKYVDQYERLLDEAGVEFKGNVNVGPVDGFGNKTTEAGIKPLMHNVSTVSLTELRSKYNAVLIAVGASLPRKLQIPGEENENIIYALDYLKNPSAYKLGKRVIVVGGGNVTMDACRTARRMGHDTTVYYRKSFENMPANVAEVQDAIDEGVEFRLFEVPVAIEGQTAIMRKCENVTGPDGRISTKMIEGSDHAVEFDTILVAISSLISLNVFGDEQPELNHGWPVTDECQQTSLPGVFIAGDFILGPATVVEAVKSARTAVEGIRKYLEI